MSGGVRERAVTNPSQRSSERGRGWLLCQRGVVAEQMQVLVPGDNARETVGVISPAQERKRKQMQHKRF